MIDNLGNEIQIGNIVTYISRAYSQPRLMNGKVTKVDDRYVLLKSLDDTNLQTGKPSSVRIQKAESILVIFQSIEDFEQSQLV